MKLFRTVLSAVLIFSIPFLCIACTAASETAPPSESAAMQPPASAAGRQASVDAAAGTEALITESAETAPGSKDGYPVEITDFLGYTSNVQSAGRIVSLTTSSTQILMALGAENHIVGVDAYSEPFLPGTEIVGDYTGPDIEKITALEPDVVIAANSIQQESIDQLRSAGIPVLAAEPTTWDQVSEGFEMIGAAVNNASGARALSDQLASTVDSVRSSAPAEPVSCYYVLSYGDAGNWTSGEGSFINAMMEHAGGAPVTKGTASPWLEYPLEDLAVADPDCIILGSGAGTLEDFMHTAGYRDLSAVRSGHVYEIDSDLVTIPSQNLNEGLKGVSYIIQEAAATDLQEAA